MGEVIALRSEDYLEMARDLVADLDQDELTHGELIALAQVYADMSTAASMKGDTEL